MSIADKITRLQTAKTAIANAITAKGGTVSAGDGFEDFATDIGTIITDKLIIDGDEYTAVTTTVDGGTEGYLTFVLEE